MVVENEKTECDENGSHRGRSTKSAVDVGQRVRVIKGKHAGVTGLVVEVLKGGWIHVRRDDGSVVSVQGRSSLSGEEDNTRLRKPFAKVNEDVTGLRKELEEWRARAEAKRREIEALRFREAERRQVEAAARELERQRAEQINRERLKVQQLREAARAMRLKKEAVERAAQRDADKKRSSEKNSRDAWARFQEFQRREDDRHKWRRHADSSKPHRKDVPRPEEDGTAFDCREARRKENDHRAYVHARERARHWQHQPKVPPRQRPAPHRPDGRLARASHFKVLDLDPSAKTPEIKRQFKQLAKKHHPDKHYSRESIGKATELMARINEAFAILKDVTTREKYKRDVIAGNAK